MNKEFVQGQEAARVHDLANRRNSTRSTRKQLADALRAHWGIENRLHWVRDVTFDEDRSQIRTGHGPAVMATLRNLVISLHRTADATNIAQACRTVSRHRQPRPTRPGVTLRATLPRPWAADVPPPNVVDETAWQDWGFARDEVSALLADGVVSTTR